jgi:uncharacterized protein (TIGR03437 family)
VGLVGLVASAWGFPFGPPTALTQAPNDRPGVTCTACHVGTAINGGGGSIRIAFANGLTYTPGQAQTLTITLSDSQANLFGFELTARADSSPNTTQAGGFTAGKDQRIVCADNQLMPAGGCGGNGIQWIEHSAPSLTGVFSVTWTPPATSVGNIHLFISGNGANGDNTRQGDHIYCAEYVLVPASTATTGVPTITSVAMATGAASGIQNNSWITINGTNFGTAQTTWDSAIVGNVFPTTLGGVTVSVNGKPAPVSFVSATQINALAPNDATLGPVDVIVSNAVGSSKATSVQMNPSAPGFFTFAGGKYIAALVLDSAGASTFLAPAGALGTGVTSRAAKAGETVVLYGTGFGRTVTQLATNIAASAAAPLAHTGGDNTLPIQTMTIGGTAATVSFAGMVFPGLYQLNVVVPQVAAGDQAVVLNLLIGSSTSQQTVSIPVQ